MGIAGFLALLFNTLAFMGQSSHTLMFGRRLNARGRSLTGYGLAATLLAFGFFMAGVPLGDDLVEVTRETAVANQIIIVTATPTPAPEIPASDPPSGTPQTGAFAPLPTEEGGETAVDDTPTPLSPNTDGTDDTTRTVTPTATSTPTSSPTPTLFPTMTPTPIDGQTAVVIAQGGLTSVYQTPGGQSAAQVRNNDTVILQSGHANRNGAVWQEVMLLDGRVGWIPEEFLTFDK